MFASAIRFENFLRSKTEMMRAKTGGSESELQITIWNDNENYSISFISVNFVSISTS